MKGLISIAMLFLVTRVEAQDFCKQVKRETIGSETQYDFYSPFTPNKFTPVRLKRSISKDEDYPYDRFYLVLYMTCGIDDINTTSADGIIVEKSEKGMVLEFDDNSRIVDDTVDVVHDFTEDRTEAIRYIFYPLTESEINDLASKKMIKYTLAGQQRSYPLDSAAMIMEYTKCIREKQ